MENAWIIKHLPKTKAEVVGRGQQLAQLERYLDNYKKAKPVLLAGPPGCGKTSIILAIAKERDLEVIEVNASDKRNKGTIESTIGAALKQQSLFMKQRLVLIDEVDGVSGNADRGGLSTLIKLFSKSGHAIVCTANDANSDKLKALRKACQVIELEPLPHDSVVERLSAIAGIEKIDFDPSVVKAVARRSGGDLRAAINDLQTVASSDTHDLSVLGDRDTTDDIVDALLRVFKTTSADVARPAFDNVPENLDKIFLWLDENLPREYTKPADIARAYTAMSEADRYFGRIRRWQYYRFYVYVYAMLSVGVALAKDEKYKTVPTYKRSGRPLKIWISNNANLKKKRIAEKIADGTHASTRRVMQDMPIHVAACRDSSYLTMLSERFDLDVDEIAWLKKKA